jgi:hypothetical protein
VFAIANNFQPSLILSKNVVSTRVEPLEEPYSNGRLPSLQIEKTEVNTHVFLRYGITYGRKKSYNTGPVIFYGETLAANVARNHSIN